MKNQEQGSPTQMVGQNAHKFLETNPPLTPSQAERAAQFLSMFRPEAAPGAVAGTAPPTPPGEGERQSLAALPAINGLINGLTEPPKPHRKLKKATSWTQGVSAALKAQEDPQERPAWLLDALEIEHLEPSTLIPPPAPKLRKQVQRKPLPPLADLIKLEQYRPKRGRGAGTAGAGALAELLYEQARTALASRLYLYDEEGNPPPQIVLHLSAELNAASLGISENTLREHTAQLVADGYLFAKPHYTTATMNGEPITVIDGMLYAVRLAPGHTARLRYGDYKKQYRNLDADRSAGRTAYNAIRNAQRRAAEALEAQKLEGVPDGEKNTEGSPNPTGQVQAELREQLKRWTVIPGNISLDPLTADPSVFSPEEVAARLNGVQDVVYLLPTLTAAHASKRAALVGLMAATLARDLGDYKSRNYFCKIIWEAWQEELEGREGLQHLAAQLQRLEVDRREWTGLRNPAALLAARLRAA